MDSTQNNISLSIIVPIRNMEGRLDNLKSWLPKAIEYENEVILIIDISEDNTRKEVEDIQQSLGSQYIKVALGVGNGPGGARDIGIQSASNSWIAFWDSDDVGDVTQLNIALREISTQTADILIGRYSQSRDSCSIETNHKVEKWNENLIPVALNPGIWRMAFKRNLVSQISFSNSFMGEDQVFLGRVLKKYPKIAWTERILYYYFTDVPGQLTSVKRNMSHIQTSLLELDREIKNSESKHDLLLFIMVWRQIFTLFTKGRLSDRYFLLKFIFNVQRKSLKEGKFLRLNKAFALLLIHIGRGSRN